MAYATNDGIGGIDGECGGNMSCGTCHVHIQPDWQALIGPAQGQELGMLEWRDNFDPTASRLSCQIILTDAMEGMKVSVPAEE